MSQETIVCKPTPWFLFRAAVMCLMFSVFAVLFYKDGSTGYRKKNEVFYLRQAFKEANDRFSEMKNRGSLTPAEWREYASEQTVKLPEDRSIMPADAPHPYPWPEILRDYEKMQPLQWDPLWTEYSGTRGLDSKPPEHPYDAGKIHEQWVVFWICLALALGAAFFLIRTKFRVMKVDDDSFTAANGKRIPFAEMKTLDLRKWDTKGLAFLEHEGGRARIDGLTYGGFKKEDGEPAEKLMQKLRENFRGEIIEFAVIEPTGAEN